MRIRQVDQNGDIVFGQPNDYYVNSLQGMALLLKDRLNLWLGTWFANTEDGVPYLQEIIGKAPRPVVDALIQERIMNTQNVIEIEEFIVNFNSNTRQYMIQCKVKTSIGVVTLNETLT